MAPRVSLSVLALVSLAACDRKADEAAPPPARTAPPAAASSAAAAAPTAASAAPSATALASAAGSGTPTPAEVASASAGLSAGQALCEKMLTAADIKAACGTDSSPAGPSIMSGLVPPSFVCARRFTLGERSLSLTLTAYPEPAAAKRAFDEVAKGRSEEPEFKALPGLGDAGRRFIAISLTNDLNHTIELRKGVHTLKVLTPKVTSNGRDLAPFCNLDQLEALGKVAASRL